MSFLLHFSSYLVGGNVPIDDGVDKLNRKYTILILVSLSLPLVTKQFAGDPIECFTPTYFTEPQARYVNSYCWTASTYYIIPVDEEKQLVTRVHSVTFEEGGTASVTGERIKVNYYQWAPIILLVEAGLFYVPFAIWNATAKNSGIKVGRLLKKVTIISQYTPGHPDRDALIVEFLDQFNTLMGVAKCCPGTVCKFDCSSSASCAGAPSSSLFVLYMLIKLLYVVNIIVQYFLLTVFLGEGYLYHGLEILEKLVQKKEWWTSPRFPLQTLCQVRAAQQGALRTYTCQCVLPINLFNEKIFSFVWFFFATLLPITIYSGLIWVWRTLTCSRIAFIHYYLWRTRRIGKEDLYNNARKMAVDYLGWDGCLVLRLVEMNHGGTILTTLTERLWEFYEGLEKAQQDGGDPDTFMHQRQPLYSCGPIQPPPAGAGPSTQSAPYRFYGRHFIPGASGAYPGYMWNHPELASPSYSSYPRIRGKISLHDRGSL
ncbi:innexin unc-9 isoform X2 [Hyalella azteca]|uniref:Innexin n=1 Tax=Hyalella azteca TaxID=294128 RepID=A0A8B7PGD8_HYAAZ|nr:innexin unc-9 isoform X2 [Hyalella azteca]